MSGLPRFNFPAFEAAAVDLRARGYEVVSPAELDSPAHREAASASPDGDIHAYGDATGETWADLLARDVKLITDGGIEGAVVLPGWERSRGARLETFVAAAINDLPVLEYAADLEPVECARLVHAWGWGEPGLAARLTVPLEIA